MGGGASCTFAGIVLLCLARLSCNARQPIGDGANSLLSVGLPSDAGSSTGAAASGNIDLKEHRMPQRDKSAHADKQQRQASAIEKAMNKSA